MSSNSNLTNMRRLVEQLKLEASVERIKVSQAAAELQLYCLQNACKDALLSAGHYVRPEPGQMLHELLSSLALTRKQTHHMEKLAFPHNYLFIY
ncbi:hypothetical protein AAFF_G00373070 [Aldrovandia affinis]|uniref:Guanine nucleotide-binding protein subunit gamma n=1 Tax=Aldrovandia affinis TaxID=143900 RepID=A0AAD7WM91_9TELE|nr:hypothetical protein AAFF_G00373070 [Aldrovandia affinis]